MRLRHGKMRRRPRPGVREYSQRVSNAVRSRSLFGTVEKTFPFLDGLYIALIFSSVGAPLALIYAVSEGSWVFLILSTIAFLAGFVEMITVLGLLLAGGILLVRANFSYKRSGVM